MSFLQKHKKYAPLFLLGALATFCIVVWILVFANTPSGLLRVAVLDVGQGDAIYIESPTGSQVIVDGGPDDSLLRDLPKVMPLFDRSLDAIVETHPDADHLTGFIDLLKRYSIGAFLEPGIPKDTLAQNTLEQEVASEKIPRYIARRGMVLDLGGGAQLDILSPDHDVSHLNPNFDNEGCVVARLVYGKTSVLLTCDAPQDVENHLMSIGSSAELASTILKVAHHGSHFSTSAAFVAAVHPEVAIISVGANNRYGHPSGEVLSTLASASVPTLRTDQAGTILFESDGNTFWRVR